MARSSGHRCWHHYSHSRWHCGCFYRPCGADAPSCRGPPTTYGHDISCPNRPPTSTIRSRNPLALIRSIRSRNPLTATPDLCSSPASRDRAASAAGDRLPGCGRSTDDHELSARCCWNTTATAGTCTPTARCAGPSGCSASIGSRPCERYVRRGGAGGPHARSGPAPVATTARRRRPQARPAPPPASFLAPPPTPPPGSLLVRVWLAD